MRVTEGMLSASVLADLQNAEVQAMDQQAMLASGKRVQKPSDDPGASAEALRIQSDLARTQQYQANVKDGQAWLQATDGALATAGSAIEQVRSLVVAAASGTQTQTDRAAVAQQVEQLKNALLDASNTRFTGHYLFSGSQTQTAAYGAVGGTIAYQGDNGQAVREIGPSSVATVNVTGSAAFGNATDPAFIFNVLAALTADLKAGNTANLGGADLQNLDTSLSSLLAQRASAGATLGRLTAADSRLQEMQVNAQTLLAGTTNADLAGTILQFQQQQQALQLALGASARLVQPSLLDFLR